MDLDLIPIEILPSLAYCYEQLNFGLVDYINYYNYDRPQLNLNKMTPHEYDEYLSEPYLRKLQLPAIITPSVIYL